MIKENDDTLEVVQERQALKFYIKLSYSLLRSLVNLCRSDKKPEERYQFIEAKSKAISLLRYLIITWKNKYGTMPAIGEWFKDCLPAQDENIKEGFANLRVLAIPIPIIYRLVKDLHYIRDRASRGWNKYGKL